jgi:hypothetical protein
MPQKPGQSVLSARPYLPLFFALVIFSGLAVFLFLPFRPIGNLKECLTQFNSILAAGGCFLLSRRWLASFNASALAGAVFGFGPFLLSFKIYHPLAGFIAAVSPWLFCPVALWDCYAAPTPTVQIRRLILLIVPFAFIFLFFWLSSLPCIGPYDLMPRTQQFHPANLPMLAGFPGPFGKQIILGLYANVFILALMGLIVYLALLRIAVLAPVLIGLVFSFCQPILDVPPVLWMAIPMLFLSILAGLGAQTMAWAGPTDRKWILFCMLIAALLGGICLTKAYFGQDRSFFFPAKMYGIAFLTTTSLFFLVKLKLSGRLLQWILIVTAIALDLILTGRIVLSNLS